MKRFDFNLQSVLSYKERVEENEKNILANLNNELTTFRTELENLRLSYRQEITNFENETKKGMTVQTALSMKVYIKSIEKRIELKLEQIKFQERKIQRQTQVVVKASQDRKILGKLKEKKFQDYTKKVNKEEEQFVEEFVSYQKIIQQK